MCTETSVALVEFYSSNVHLTDLNLFNCSNSLTKERFLEEVETMTNPLLPF